MADKNTCLKLHKTAYRLAAKGGICTKLADLIRYANQILLGCYIGNRADIDETCTFPHNGMGVVIHDAAHIGPRTTIFQQVTIGVSYQGGLCVDEAPRIGSDVIIGAGAKLLGKITIGDGARIGANAVVVRDVPAYSTAIGVPARIIFHKDKL